MYAGAAVKVLDAHRAHTEVHEPVREVALGDNLGAGAGHGCGGGCRWKGIFVLLVLLWTWYQQIEWESQELCHPIRWEGIMTPFFMHAVNHTICV